LPQRSDAGAEAGGSEERTVLMERCRKMEAAIAALSTSGKKLSMEERVALRRHKAELKQVGGWAVRR